MLHKTHEANPFRNLSWQRLVQVIEGVKGPDRKKKTPNPIDDIAWEDACAEVRHIERVMADRDFPLEGRLETVRRIKGVACQSLKVTLPRNNPGDIPTWADGTVEEIHTDLQMEDGSWIRLPHVTFRTEAGDGRMRHRLEEIKLKTESWWFSHAEVKPKKRK